MQIDPWEISKETRKKISLNITIAKGHSRHEIFGHENKNYDDEISQMTAFQGTFLEVNMNSCKFSDLRCHRFCGIFHYFAHGWRKNLTDFRYAM